MYESKRSYRETRADFERHLHLLGEVLREGKIKFTMQSIRATEGITKVRYAPNRRVNLHTVNEMVRVTAMMVDRQNLDVDENE